MKYFTIFLFVCLVLSLLTQIERLKKSKWTIPTKRATIGDLILDIFLIIGVLYFYL